MFGVRICVNTKGQTEWKKQMVGIHFCFHFKDKGINLMKQDETSGEQGVLVLLLWYGKVGERHYIL